MNSFFKFFLLVLMCVCVAPGFRADAQGHDFAKAASVAEPDGGVGKGLGNYRLDVGDKIKIHVFGEDDMDVEVRLGPSGDIRYPFLGKIHVAGMTRRQLEKKITRGLADGYLVNPQVRVSLEEFRPFYVNGEVEKPGAYPYRPGLTYRMAISIAGGFKEKADKDEILVIHDGKGKKSRSVTNLDGELRPGDLITVKQSFF